MSALSPNSLLQDRIAQQQAPEPQPQPEPRFLTERPVQTPPAQPTLISKPTGMPIAPLSGMGYWGSINDFNQDVQKAHNAYVAANGVRPDPKTLLSMVINRGPALQNTPIGPQDQAKMLDNLRQQSVDPQSFHNLIQDNSDTLEAMLRDPKTHAKTLASINAAETSAYYHGHDQTSEIWSGVKAGAAQVAATTIALGKDLGNLGAAAAPLNAEMSPGRGDLAQVARVKQAMEFPHLSQVSPTIAQVVKGLIYSPAGVVQAAAALAKDNADMALWVASGGKRGNPTFQHTSQLAKQVGLGFYKDITDPGGHAGYLLLDAWGLFSLGAGTIARVGRAAATIDEGAGIGAAIKAAASPHPIQTVEYKKGSYAENISLPANPAAALVAKNFPVIGTEDQLRVLADPTFDPLARLLAPIGGHDKSTQVISAVGERLNPLTPEARMGRAGSIRRSTETKALSYMAQRVEDAAGWSAHQTFLDNAMPDWALQGLTRGEVKAIQIASWDVPGGWDAKASAEETLHQWSIEQGVGWPKQHAAQIRDIALAREAMKNPSDRLQRVMNATVQAATAGEELRLAHGLPPEIAEARVREPGFAMQLAQMYKDIEGQLQNIGGYQPLRPGEEIVYHGTQSPFDKYDTSLSKESSYGPGVYVSTNQAHASHYAELDRSDIQPEARRVNIHRIDTNSMLDVRSANPDLLNEVRAKVEGVLSPDEKSVLQGLHEGWSWDNPSDVRNLYDMLSVAGRILGEEGKLGKDWPVGDVATFNEGQRWAQGVLRKAGYTGLKDSRSPERVVFNPGDLHPHWGSAPSGAELEQRLTDIKSALGNLDVRFVPEGYERGEPTFSSTVTKKFDALEKKRQQLSDLQDKEAKWLTETKAKHPDLPLPSNQFADRIRRLSERIEEDNREAEALKNRERNAFVKANPPPGLPEGYYARVGDEWVPVNRGTDDSFYVPLVLRGKTQRTPMGQIRLPGSIFGIGKNTASPWETHRMTGQALMSGDFRIDAHNMTAQSLSKTVRAIVKIDAWNKAWDAARELEPGEHPNEFEIPIRDINDIPYDLRRSILSFWEGHLRQDQADALSPDLNKELFPEDPTNKHVRYIDQRILGDLFFKEWERKLGAAEPAIRMMMSPINNTLRPLILYNPKYILNALGNEAMLVFDQGFIKSSQNLARAFGMKDWSLGDDYEKTVKLMGAGKASSYISGETKTYGSIASQALADFWSRVSDKDFRIASFIYYADRAGAKTPEEINALLNPTDAKGEALLNDVVKRGNDALVAFDRMSPIEKAVLRHFIFVYPWQRGAVIWSFRALFEHPAKAALLANLGQENYTYDDWLGQVPGWVRRTGYIPFHWAGDTVRVLNPTSINTFSTLSDVLSTIKAWIEGDKYASTRDLLGPAGQFFIGAASGVDSYGNPYKSGHLLGAMEDTLNMLPIYAAEQRAAKGSGKPIRAFDITSRSGLSSVLASALKATSLDPGWLDGWGNILAGGFSPRELRLTPNAARYWANAPAKERHQHELDLLMRQLVIQSHFLKTGKLPSDQEVLDMVRAPLGSVKVKGQIPEGVRKAVLDAAQISQINSEWSKKYGTTPPMKQRILNSLRYYKEAGRMSQSVYEKEAAAVKRLDATPDLQKENSVIATKYGYAKDLYEWDKRVRLQNSFANSDTGPANLNQRLSVLYQNGLAQQFTFALNDSERAQYGHLYTQYIAARDDLKAKLRDDVTLSASERTARLNAFDSRYTKPVRIDGKTLPSLAALAVPTMGESSTVAAATVTSNQRILKLTQVSWGRMSSAQKEVFGKKVSAEVADGWVTYYHILQQQREAGHSATSDLKQQVAAYVNRYYAKGFMQDWLYARTTPKIDRFVQSKAYQSMPNRDIFDKYIAAAAKSAGAAMANGSADLTGTRSAWKKYITDTIMPWLQKNYPQLYNYIQPLGTSWVTSLINTDP